MQGRRSQRGELFPVDPNNGRRIIRETSMDDLEER